jgi:hypothetical protein
MLEAKRNEPCISDLLFDQARADCIEPEVRAQIQAHLAACVRCALRHEVLCAQHAAFLERAPSWEIFRAQRELRAGPVANTHKRAAWLSGAGLAALAVLSLIVVRQNAPRHERAKGGPRIAAYVKRGERVTLALDGDSVQVGDYLRFTYTSDVPLYFALLNRDAHSAVKYYPVGDQTVRVRAGRDVPLDFSIELDDQKGPERVHALFCDRPQRLEPLRVALQASGHVPALADCRIDVLTLVKRQAKE